MNLKQAYYVSADKKRWYYHFKEDKNGLLKFIREDDKYNKLLIVNTIENVRYYTDFDSYIDYFSYISNLPTYMRCCDEIILGDRNQKIRFDIDASKSEIENIQILLDQLISSIIEEMKLEKVNINLEKDIILCSSNNDVKFSYHLILNNWFCLDCHEAKEWYERILKNIDISYKKFIDASIYSENHTLRIVGSTKKGEIRIKKFMTEWKYRDQIIKYKYEIIPKTENKELLLQIKNSLITYTNNCKLLPKIFDETQQRNNKNFDINFECDEKLLEAIKYKIKEIYPDEFRIDKIVNNIIICVREKESYCWNCERIHEHQHPFLYIKEIKINNKVIYEIFYSCRRSYNKKMEKLFDICFSDKKEEMKKEKMMNQQIKELIYIAKKEKENIFS
jgi:hypothetical protein